MREREREREREGEGEREREKGREGGGKGGGKEREGDLFLYYKHLLSFSTVLRKWTTVTESMLTTVTESIRES